MSRKTPTWESVHVAFLGLCVGAVGMVGAVAAVAFPTAHKLNPKLAGMEAYTGEHWILTAGGIMAPAFTIAAYVQYACVVGAAVAFAIARWPRKETRFSKLLLARSLLIIGLVFVSGYQAATLRPRMDKNLGEIWERARAGDNPGAASAKAAFDADHGTSRTVLEATLALALAGVVLACVSAAKPNPTAGDSERLA